MKAQRVKRFSVVIACIFFCSLGLNILFAIGYYEQSRVVAVADGDSLDLQDGRRVRLLGLDAPEKDRCMYAEAKARLTGQVMGRHVRLKDVVKDDYGRILANVILDAPFDQWMGYLSSRFILRTPYYPTAYVNALMVQDGLAKYTGSQKGVYGTWLKRVSDEAKAKKLGIYSPRCVQTIPTNADCPIKGNVRSGEKTYHVPGCDNYGQTIVDLSFGDQWFCTQEEAENAGFRMASGCHPH